MEVLEVTCAESDDGGIEALVVEWKLFSFGKAKRDEMRETAPLDFLFSSLQHLFSDVHADDLVGMKSPRRQRKIGSACCHIEDRSRLHVPEMLDRSASPREIHTTAQEMIEQIVAVCNGIEEGTNVLFVHDILTLMDRRKDTELRRVFKRDAVCIFLAVGYIAA